MKQSRKWRCKSKGHIVVSEHRPDVCRECKKEQTDLWLSRFEEVELTSEELKKAQDDFSNSVVDEILAERELKRRNI